MCVYLTLSNTIKWPQRMLTKIWKWDELQVETKPHKKKTPCLYMYLWINQPNYGRLIFSYDAGNFNERIFLCEFAEVLLAGLYDATTATSALALRFFTCMFYSHIIMWARLKKIIVLYRIRYKAEPGASQDFPNWISEQRKFVSN